ncbi:MAG TPA: histidine kinase dimerization/phospho-acceptor domain-containing protein [Candidatus Acidoferrum sp.]|nr:histidine kinase dimerization/phospho-acceptor domain-containing protein [Candidatus Acidoferrum sp.]
MGNTMWEKEHGKREEFVMVCGEQAFSEEVKGEWGQRHNPVRLECVNGWQSARKLLEARTPAVILVEERTAAPDARTEREKTPPLDAVVTLFAGYAPTVVVGSAEQQAGLRALLAGGTVDFVTRAAGCLPVAMGLVERRLRRHDGWRSARMVRPLQTEDPSGDSEAGDFGEILRHELNNPLTGILGNAELLLVELRRKNVPLPPQAEHRLETIATLAVRMREAVRRLSDEWEAQSEAMARDVIQSPN